MLTHRWSSHGRTIKLDAYGLQQAHARQPHSETNGSTSTVKRHPDLKMGTSPHDAFRACPGPGPRQRIAGGASEPAKNKRYFAYMIYKWECAKIPLTQFYI